MALCVIDFNLWNKVPYSAFRSDLPSYRILRDELDDQIVQQHSTSNEHLDIVHGLETLETPLEAYQAFLMPMTLPRLPRELTMKWKRGRTDEKNSLKELLTFLKAEIRIRERYGSFDSSARVDSEIQVLLMEKKMHLKKNIPWLLFIHSGDSSMPKTTMVDPNKKCPTTRIYRFKRQCFGLSYSCNNDLLSRGLTVEQLASYSFWWHGTAWVMEDRNHHFEDMQRFDRPWSYSGRECVKTPTATCDIFRSLTQRKTL
ncbi:hypothetical protein T10_5987 [Trichinella papuae]|uniref:Uncharacterized protein n=1 Tax=Trichinella papuae TaxID=268474 RepID=A0A0V1N695_9BILA|nr:hypothetical protein T10_5987 [Trichinella papuae]